MTGLLQSSINFFRFLILQTVKFSIYLKKNHINLVHLNNSVSQGHGWILAANLTGTHCIAHERSAKLDYTNLSRFFAGRLDAVICISDAIRRKMEKCGFDNENLVTIHNGLDPNRFQVRHDAKTIRTTHHIGDKDPLIGIVGNIKSWKGQDIVVQATAEVKKLYPNIKCLIIGDTAASDRPYLHRVEQLIRDLYLSETIIFTGFQMNIPDYVNALDIVVHASTLGEPFGRVLLEAMALEKPLIGSRGGAVPEIIDEPRTGLMFEPGNHNDLARSITQLLENPDMAKAMGKKGRIRLIEHFHISKNLERTQQLYRSILFGKSISMVGETRTPATSENRLPRI
jgi:glycosyltransferase involved in cell wall biosynthesis